MASHQLSEISQYCNKCLVLNKGKVEFYGKCDEALSYYNSANALFSGSQLQTDKVAIEKVWLNSPSAVYTTADAIELCIRLTKKEAESEIIPVIYIVGTYGNVLTDSPRFRADFTGNAQQAGVYEYKVTIPSGLLNTGTYYVTIILGSINKVELEAKNISKFDVVQTDWEKNKKWEVPTFFPVRLQLNWVSNFYND
jgi:hypothetical protein